MERIEILTPEEKAKNIEFIAKTIEDARHLNKIGAKNASNALPGSEMLYGVYKANLIDRRLYHALLRVVEDTTLDYEIEI
jgi:hypothetical protein